MKDYKTGKLESYKIDEGIMDLVREYKRQSNLPISFIIEKAIYDKMKRVGLDKFPCPPFIKK